MMVMMMMMVRVRVIIIIIIIIIIILEFFHNKVQNGQTGDPGVRAADLVAEERSIEHARVTTRTAVQNVLELVIKPESATLNHVRVRT